MSTASPRPAPSHAATPTDSGLARPTEPEPTVSMTRSLLRSMGLRPHLAVIPEPPREPDPQARADVRTGAWVLGGLLVLVAASVSVLGAAQANGGERWTDLGDGVQVRHTRVTRDDAQHDCFLFRTDGQVTAACDWASR